MKKKEKDLINRLEEHISKERSLLQYYKREYARYDQSLLSGLFFYVFMPYRKFLFLKKDIFQSIIEEIDNIKKESGNKRDEYNDLAILIIHYRFLRKQFVNSYLSSQQKSLLTFYEKCIESIRDITVKIKIIKK